MQDAQIPKAPLARRLAGDNSPGAIRTPQTPEHRVIITVIAHAYALCLMAPKFYRALQGAPQ